MFDCYLDGDDMADAPIDQIVPIIIPDDESLVSCRDGLDVLEPILPVLPLRDMVLFPAVTMPIIVGRDKSIRLLNI